VRIAHFINDQSSGTLVRVQGWTSPGGAWGSAPALRFLPTTLANEKPGLSFGLLCALTE